MREIRFRVWDKETKSMYSVWDIGFKGWDGQEDSIINYVRICIDGTVDRSENQVILMQYTGLKDKNGKEIYEGDIFSIEDCEDYTMEYVDYVEFKDGMFQSHYEQNPIHAEIYNNEITIIGNIYSNPKLLEKK